MKKKYNYITIDLDKKIYTKLKAVQGDSKSRYILINLIDNNSYYDLTGTTVKIYGEKKDKTIFFNDATIIDATKGQFEIELTNQALAVAGDLKLQILILGPNQEKLSTFSFFIEVVESIIDDGAIESTNEFTALIKSLNKLEEWNGYFEETSGKIEEKYTERLNTLDEQFNTIDNKINEVATTGTTTEAIHNKISEMAQEGTITFDTVTPDMTTFLKKVIDENVNIFDGKYERYYMSGSNGALVLKSDVKGKCAILKIKKNTTYSITTNIAVLMKIATSSTLVSANGTFDGAINVSQGVSKQTLRTTGATDEYMYISLTNTTSDNYTDEEIYLKVIENNEIVLPSENEKYPVSYIPNGIDVPSNSDLQNIVEKKINVSLTENKLEVMLTSGAKITMTQTTDINKNLNVFRITKVEKGSYVFGQDVDYDGVIKIKDNTDYSGGYHGQEQETNKFFLADGKKVTSFNDYCKKFVVVVESHIYTNDGNSTNIFDKCKTITFENDNYIIENVYSCLTPCTIDHARTTLFSIDTTNISSGFVYGDVNGANATFDSSTTSGTLFFKKDINKIVASFGDTEVICELLPNSTKKSTYGMVAGFVGRIKPYIDNIKYNLDVVATDVIRSTSKYTIH